jgi:hypothetical protein
MTTNESELVEAISHRRRTVVKLFSQSRNRRRANQGQGQETAVQNFRPRFRSRQVTLKEPRKL